MCFESCFVVLTHTPGNRVVNEKVNTSFTSTSNRVSLRLQETPGDISIPWGDRKGKWQGRGSLQAAEEVPFGVAREGGAVVALVAVQHETPVPLGSAAARGSAVVRGPNVNRYKRPVQPPPLTVIALSPSDPEWPLSTRRRLAPSQPEAYIEEVLNDTLSLGLPRQLSTLRPAMLRRFVPTELHVGDLLDAHVFLDPVEGRWAVVKAEDGGGGGGGGGGGDGGSGGGGG